ncbi:hypothetical protein Rhopal_007425-T1 [Rhodotorula paludigena]|uniref:NAD(P)-binding protein n=1 Tax=Rhodotorula paludigena TaxID=86838 RepID=A0AAV5GP33_9BASI|nr:hypothetical protein Rhopal_007425-T1 [Rhodotorula paludigena]
MAAKTVYVVTGTNRGIGLGLVTELVKRKDALVFATARNPDKADALHALAKEHDNLEIVKLETTSEAESQAAAALVKEKAGRVDYLIANAGIANLIAPILDTPVQKLREHFEVNTVGTQLTFQAFAPLLFASPSPHFVVVSTTVGSIGMKLPLAMTAYGASKAALNFLTAQVAVEHGDQNNLAAYAISPGLVGTDLGNQAVAHFGMAEAPVKLEQSVAGVLGIVDKATRESTGGRFWDYTGDELQW